MKTPAVTTETSSRSLLLQILLSGLLVGTLDILSAITSFMIKGGTDPSRVLVYIASAVFGKDAYSGSTVMPALGLLFHYIIAFGWTVIFYLTYPLVAPRINNRVVHGIAYGLVIWMFMNLVVVPMSAVVQLPFKWSSALLGASILIVAIGLPLSFMAHRYYTRRES